MWDLGSEVAHFKSNHGGQGLLEPVNESADQDLLNPNFIDVFCWPRCVPPRCVMLLLLSRFSRVRLCDPIDGSPPGSPIPRILQARTLEWVAISFSNAWKWKMKEKSLSRVRLLATPWTAAHQAPPSMGFSRQEYWSGVPLPSPRCVISISKLPSPK